MRCYKNAEKIKVLFRGNIMLKLLFWRYKRARVKYVVLYFPFSSDFE